MGSGSSVEVEEVHRRTDLGDCDWQEIAAAGAPHANRMVFTSFEP